MPVSATTTGQVRTSALASKQRERLAAARAGGPCIERRHAEQPACLEAHRLQRTLARAAQGPGFAPRSIDRCARAAGTARAQAHHGAAA
jgi:hypothetical protein